MLNIEQRGTKIAEIHSVVEDALGSNRSSMRQAHSFVSLLKLFEGDNVVVAREDFTAGGKLSLR